ncbi:alpha-1B adrenergic receptor-like [Lytechinus variegatus]|uniref:alpha-1B adrenergic receptor-like n=1 Tax=Lytechinus variegatus TaxID=7654 RepID=UPI001BB2B7BF|nr:alpha-1B adrenergic receptor-like [Lytechinus variegatus]
MIGNSIVILAIIVSRKLRSTTNWFVLNLACADFLSSTSLPFHVVTMLDKTDSAFPNWFCTLISVIRLTCLSVSMIMLAMIGFTRWFLITKPLYKFKKVYRPRNLKLTMTFSWIYSALWVVIPHFAGLGTLGFSFQFKICQWDSSTDPFKDFYALLGGFGVFFMFALVIINYLLIYRFVARHGRKMKALMMGHTRREPAHDVSMDNVQDHGTPSPPMTDDQDTQMTQQSQSDGMVDSTNSAATRAEKHENKNHAVIKKQSVVVTKRLAVIVFVFFISFMPFGISILVAPWRPVVPWTLPIFYISNCINPLIYAGTMPTFREVMRFIIKCRWTSIPASIF